MGERVWVAWRAEKDEYVVCCGTCSWEFSAADGKHCEQAGREHECVEDRSEAATKILSAAVRSVSQAAGDGVGETVVGADDLWVMPKAINDPPLWFWD